MAFRLPANLGIGRQYTAVSPGDVTALEEALPANSRMLVGLVFAERYDGFEADCVRANERLLEEPGLLTWLEYPGKFVTPDADGNPIAWIHYQSSPAWWTLLLITLGSTFLLPIIAVLPAWIIDLMFPGFMETITMVVMIMIMGGIMLFMPKLMAPAKEEK